MSFCLHCIAFTCFALGCFRTYPAECLAGTVADGEPSRCPHGQKPGTARAKRGKNSLRVDRTICDAMLKYRPLMTLELSIVANRPLSIFIVLLGFSNVRI